MADIINQPITFLGLTVLSFGCQLGLGGSESRLNVELVEDCETNIEQSFQGQIGYPYIFQAGEFQFGGILSNWTYNQSSSGRTYSVTIVDPRQLLQNSVVIVDTYLGEPLQYPNYFNAYNYWEGRVLSGECEGYGEGDTGDQGMPYTKVIEALIAINPTIYSPTGGSFKINFNSFPQNIPNYYRVSGPSVTILQLLQDVCDVIGLEFYAYLIADGATNYINIGTIDLKRPISANNAILNFVSQYDGQATDISYGRELRNEITKTILFGDKVHYLSNVSKFNHFFGQDFINNEYVPVVPHEYDECGFWIRKKVDSLNLILDVPLPGNGPYTIHELDIRSAMASQQLWEARVFNPQIGGSFNEAVRNTWPELIDNNQTLAVLNSVSEAAKASKRGVIDKATAPNKARIEANQPKAHEEIKKIWSFIKNLGDTYYGKQFITPLEQQMCYYYNKESLIGEKIFTDVPTNAGGWVDYGTAVLGLNDPELSFFREQDGRVRCFALFNNAGSYQE